jgi:hypothetical protein
VQIFIYPKYLYADRGTDTLFWTDMTRQGCAGHYSACFTDGFNFDKIHATPFDGNCVAVYGAGRLLYKTMQCKKRLLMGCVGQLKAEKTNLHLIKVSKPVI